MTVQVLVVGIDNRTSCLQLDGDGAASLRCVKQVLFYRGVVSQHQRFRLVSSRFDLDDDDLVEDGAMLTCVQGLLGGKGGFGSLLRGASTKVGQKATSNFTACRDLSGRRIRHIDDEKALAKWKAEQEKEKAETSSSSISLRKQYINIKTDTREREVCKYGGDCKYQHKGCRFDHPKTQKNHVELTREFAESSSRSGASFDMSASIEQGLRKRKAVTESSGMLKRTMVAQSNSSADKSDAPSSSLKVLSTKKYIAGHDDTSKRTQEPNDNAPCELAVKAPPAQKMVKPVPKVDLSQFTSWEELQSLGLDVLKNELQAHGLKCGGTLTLRAQRLFLLNQMPRDQIPKKHFST